MHSKSNANEKDSTIVEPTAIPPKAKPPTVWIGDIVLYYHGRGLPSESKVTRVYPDGAVDLETLQVIQATGKIEIGIRIPADMRETGIPNQAWRPKPPPAGY
jgi:hypothetical protein